MNQIQTPTEFYKQRDLGEKINATFDFLLKNYKKIFSFMLKKVLPIILIINIIPAFLPDYFISNMTQHHLSSSAPLVTLVYFLAYFFIMIIAQSIVITLLYGNKIVSNQENPENFDENVEINENIFKIFLTGFLSTLIIAGCSLLLIIPGIIVAVILSYAQVVAVFENISPTKAISRCWSFGFTKWWSTLGLMFVVGIISAILNMIFSIPEYIFTFINIFSSHGNVDPNNISYSLIFYVVHSVSVFGAVLLSSITYVALAYQYANIREIKESLSINDKISNFEDQ